MLNKFMSESRKPPVEENEVLQDLYIESVGSSLDGVGKFNGFVIFVPDTVIGDNVDVLIKMVKPNFAFAEKL